MTQEQMNLLIATAKSSANYEVSMYDHINGSSYMIQFFNNTSEGYLCTQSHSGLTLEEIKKVTNNLKINHK